MTEIKSSIDLAMERTRNLSMTKDERDAARMKDATGKARGWIQRYLDDVIDLLKIEASFAAEERDIPEIRNILKNESIDFLRLDADNEKLFRFFEQVLGIESEPFRRLVESFLAEIEQERERRVEQTSGEFAQRRISGSSVAPNLLRNDAWVIYTRTMEESFGKAARDLLTGQR